MDIEEKYTSLQEEAQGKTKKLKKVWTMLMAAKSEVRVLETAHNAVQNLNVSLQDFCFVFVFKTEFFYVALTVLEFVL